MTRPRLLLAIAIAVVTLAAALVAVAGDRNHGRAVAQHGTAGRDVSHDTVGSARAGDGPAGADGAAGPGQADGADQPYPAETSLVVEAAADGSQRHTDDDLVQIVRYRPDGAELLAELRIRALDKVFRPSEPAHARSARRGPTLGVDGALGGRAHHPAPAFADRGAGPGRGRRDRDALRYGRAANRLRGRPLGHPAGGLLLRALGRRGAVGSDRPGGPLPCLHVRQPVRATASQPPTRPGRHRPEFVVGRFSVGRASGRRPGQ